MNIFNYILIGIVFMFLIEYSLNTEYVKNRLPKTTNIGWVERFIGVFFWPVCLGIFLYSFIKEISK